MLKFLALVFILLSFVSCGVDTSSSSQTAKVEESTGTGTDTLTPPPLVELNPIVDANSTVPSDGTIDPGDGTIDPGDGTTVGDGGDQNNSVFDVTNAVYDKFACIVGDVNDGYTPNSISDTSIDDRGVEDIEDGVLINSRVPLRNSDSEGTRVFIFYYDLKSVRDMLYVNIYDDLYKLSVDKGWGYNEEKTLYVMTPPNGGEFYSCYRYDLTNITDGSYVKTKVYRNIVN